MRAISGHPLKDWTHEDLGTVVSVGERAVATNVQHVPVSTFGGFPAALLKKAIANLRILGVGPFIGPCS